MKDLESGEIQEKKEDNKDLYEPLEKLKLKKIKNKSEDFEEQEGSKSNHSTTCHNSEDCSDTIDENEDNNEEKMDFNLKTTIAHLQGDLVYSVGVFISAVIINIFPKARFFDSICSLLFSYVALKLTAPIFKEAIRILLEGTPEGILLLFLFLQIL